MVCFSIVLLVDSNLLYCTDSDILQRMVVYRVMTDLPSKHKKTTSLSNSEGFINKNFLLCFLSRSWKFE